MNRKQMRSSILSMLDEDHPLDAAFFESKLGHNRAEISTVLSHMWSSGLIKRSENKNSDSNCRFMYYPMYSTHGTAYTPKAEEEVLAKPAEPYELTRRVIYEMRLPNGKCVDLTEEQYEQLIA